MAVTLGLHGNVGARVMRLGREGVERRPHVELNAGGIEQGEVDRDAARMGRAATRVGEEFGVGAGVPQRPLRFDRAQRVEYAQPAAQRLRKLDREAELLRGLAMQPAFGIPVDRPAR